MPKTKPTTNSVVEIKRYPSTLIHKHKSEDRDEYKGRNFLELMNYDVVFKPKPAFGQLPSQITFIYKSGYQKVLFQR